MTGPLEDIEILKREVASLKLDVQALKRDRPETERSAFLVQIMAHEPEIHWYRVHTDSLGSTLFLNQQQFYGHMKTLEKRLGWKPVKANRPHVKKVWVPDPEARRKP